MQARHALEALRGYSLAGRIRSAPTTQREANALAARVNDVEAEFTRRLADARQKVEEHVTRELKAAAEEYRPLRIAGCSRSASPAPSPPL